MAFGFGFASNLVPQARSSQFIYAWGTSLGALFVLLRYTGVYGDPQPWQPQSTFLTSLLAFVNCEKYPPSLQFLLMTLAPVLFVYPLIGKIRGKLSKILLAFGKVPLFFYRLQIPLIHAVALIMQAMNHQSLSWLLDDFPLLNKPETYGLSLTAIYLLWLMNLAILYPACQGYGSGKFSRRQWWSKLLQLLPGTVGQSFNAL
jgi:hypothetical protein